MVGASESDDEIKLIEISSEDHNVDKNTEKVVLKEIERFITSRDPLKFTKSMYASVFLAVIILPTLFISLPIVLDLELKPQDTTANIQEFSRTNIVGDTQNFELGLMVTNPSSEPFDIQGGSFDFLYKNYSLDYAPKSWILLKKDLQLDEVYSLASRDSTIVQIPFSIDESDVGGLLFLKLALMPT